MLFHIDECGSHFAVVKTFERPLTETASCYILDGVRCATVLLDDDYDVFAIAALGISDPDEGEADHCHAHTEHLARAGMAIVFHAAIEETVKGFQVLSRFHPNASG